MNDDTKRRLGLGVAVLVITGAIVALERPWEPGSSVPPPPANIPAELAGLQGAPDFAGATGWINTRDGQPVDLLDQRGKVVLVDFWTYSCINCIRTFPYVRSWDNAYNERGLVIVGVHSPEFRFERDIDNVREATKRHQLNYSVAIDNDYDVWDAYNNRFWPSKYLVDQYGKIRYSHFGEGAYDETEAKIRELLEEAGHDPGPFSSTANVTQGAGHAGRTPELYAAGGRAAIGNPEGYRAGASTNYTLPADVEADRIYLDGTWYGEPDHVRAETDGRIVLRYSAAHANLVGSGTAGVCLATTLDGGPVPEEIAGQDIERHDDGTCIRLDEPRAYFFHEGAFGTHLLELHVPAGFELYSFAFSDRINQEET